MKNFILFSLMICCGCSKTVSQPIIDYSPDYGDQRNMISDLKKKQNEQTIVLIGSKVYSYDDFNSLIKKEKIKTFNIINKKEEIEKLNYSYNKIKTIILAEMK
ncbi:MULTISPECIES: hypothetical protein [Chryseobacterium]|uniref:hypothetical protein n=1 Tax=Chryseobacterium TaxID=59732 RepID=UPI001BEA829E|nr:MULTISPECIES: hypothetical protein [Chryseobacterium]MBT2619696.1 hypothetical protein [Chryseobacterium sp. ISL-6]